MINRRNFIKQTLAAGIAGSISSKVFSQREQNIPANSMIWGNLLHLGYNMWEDRPRAKYESEECLWTSCWEVRDWAHGYRMNLTFDENVWDSLLKEMATAGINMVIIDLGDAVVYDSHPELAVRNAWTPEKLRTELSKMRKMGLEPVPKMNFSTGHDIWLGEYSRMTSTRTYYNVCRDLIEEVIRIFDRPRFFHLGMDEETASHQRNYDYIAIRQNDLWWSDLYFLIGEVEKHGVRSWIWSDYGWRYPEQFFKKMPKSVLQSNWYYGGFDEQSRLDEQNNTYITFYDKLEQHGYDQIPTGSNFSIDTNMEDTVAYCRRLIDPSRLHGFLTTTWMPTLAPCLEKHQAAISQLGKAKKI